MNKFRQALLKFQALTLRERLMAVAATVVVLYFLIDFAMLGPQQNKSKALRQQITQQKIELDALTKVMAAGAASKATVDTLGSVRTERDELRTRVALADSFIAQAANSASLGDMLRAIISERHDLTLVSLKTLPAEVFYKPPAPAPAGAQTATAAPKPSTAPAPQLTLYKHGVEVTVKGTYPALLPYLESLQRNTNRMFWSSVKLDVTTYPEATLKMIIYTLSDRTASPLG